MRIICYNFCEVIPNKLADGSYSTSAITPDGRGAWKEKGLKFATEQEAIDYANLHNYPYFEQEYIEDGERWIQPFVGQEETQ